MNQNSPYDYVWLGLLVGEFDLHTSKAGMAQLRAKLEEVGLTETLAKLSFDDDDKPNIESVNIATWIGDELTEKGINPPYASGVNIYNSSDLINSMRPGVWANVPETVRVHLLEAEVSIRAGALNGAAKLLVGVVETMMKHLYSRIHPTPDKHASWGQIERALFDLNDSELLPTLFFAKGFWKDYRNPTSHNVGTSASYDSYEIIALWHATVSAITRMAGILERRSALPGPE